MKRIIVYYLILNVVLATLYVPVIVHKCYLFNTSETTLYSSTSCCELPKETNEQLNVNCCSFDSKTFKTDLNGQSQRLDFAMQFQPTAIAYQSDYSVNICEEVVSETSSIRPPPFSISNRTLLSHIQKLII